MFGAVRAQAIADFAKKHVAGVAANVSLGLMLGLVPTVLAFIGIPLDVRHVTLSTGSVAASVGVGFDTMLTAPFWWAVGGIASMGVLNLAVSFALAFRWPCARTARKPGMRRLLQGRLRRLLQHPLQAILPPKA